MAREKITVPCIKCDGAKRIRGFRHVEGGICFACEGTGTITGYVDSALIMSATARAAVKEWDTGFKALLAKVGMESEREYNGIGNLISASTAERGMYGCAAHIHNPARRARYEARKAFWNEVCGIVNEAVKARAIKPSALARLETLVTIRREWAENE